jgi:hypothetical protein
MNAIAQMDDCVGRAAGGEGLKIKLGSSDRAACHPPIQLSLLELRHDEVK